MSEWHTEAEKNTNGSFPFDINNLKKFESLLMDVNICQYGKFLRDRSIYGFNPGQFLLL